MTVDAYPYPYLLKRIFDLLLFFVALALLVIAVLVGALSSESKQGLIIGLGMAASAIGALLEFRQRTIYELDHTEPSLLAGNLSIKGLNTVARLRHRCVSGHILLVVLGTWVSGYGAVWGAS